VGIDSALVRGDMLPSEGGTPAERQGPTGGGSGQTQPATALSPYRIFFSIAQVSNPGCKVPSGQQGAAKVAKYRVADASGQPAGNITITEQFKAIDDPYNLVGAIRAATYTTERSGYFDDCYLFASSQPLPSDFRLKVEQNHLINGLVASRQEISYSSFGVALCVYERRGGGFGGRCRRF
jgi:hypothetical protein